MILHLSNDFSGSTVYRNLFAELDDLGLAQIVYNPIRNSSRIGKNSLEFKNKNSVIIYSHILNKHIDRIFYRLKIKKIVKDIESKVDFSQINFIHAHTWYSDGGVAFYLANKYNIPYAITVRNSDLNFFQKYLIHERAFGMQILKKATNIIVIAASYRQRILSQASLVDIRQQLENRMLVIPNGVDSYWIENRVAVIKDKIEHTFNVLFIGKFSKGKNLAALQDAVIKFSKQINSNIVLHIVGGGGSETSKILSNVNRYPSLFKYYGNVFDKQELREIFSKCDVFAMPSKRETFGLVYVEAMLQGLPIMYRKNEGIDGFYEEKIGEAVSIGNSEDIKNKLEQFYQNYCNYEINIPLVAKNHDWKLIAQKYYEIYIK